MRVATPESKICKPNGKPQIGLARVVPLPARRQPANLKLQTNPRRNSTFQRCTHAHLPLWSIALESTNSQSAHLPPLHPLHTRTHTFSHIPLSADDISQLGLQIEQTNFPNANFGNSHSVPRRLCIYISTGEEFAARSNFSFSVALRLQGGGQCPVA